MEVSMKKCQKEVKSLDDIAIRMDECQDDKLITKKQGKMKVDQIGKLSQS